MQATRPPEAACVPPGCSCREAGATQTACNPSTDTETAVCAAALRVCCTAARQTRERGRRRYPRAPVSTNLARQMTRKNAKTSGPWGGWPAAEQWRKEGNKRPARSAKGRSQQLSPAALRATENCAGVVCCGAVAASASPLWPSHNVNSCGRCLGGGALRLGGFGHGTREAGRGCEGERRVSAWVTSSPYLGL